MTLSQIFSNRPDILDDEKKLRSAFSDFYEGDQSRVNRMMMAFDEGIVEIFLSSESADFDKRKIIDRLVNLHDMQDAKAANAVEEWGIIIDRSVVRSYESFQAKKREEAERKRIEDERKKKQSETEAKEAQDVIDVINDNTAAADNYERYINLDQSKGSIVRGIPCGVGSSDFGFRIIGAGRKDLNDNSPYPTVHALVYNFMIRNSRIQRDAYPCYMRTHVFNHELDYGHVYRFIMILLELLKPVGKTQLRLNVKGDKDELTAAIDILNEYLGVFSRLSRYEGCSVEVVNDPKAKSVSVTEKADICVENFTEDTGLKRRIRYGDRINYRLDKSDREDLEFLLKEISPFQAFKRGQFEALCSMMNANDHAVCIMPTGSGKSLIYYFACILQPQAMFVVAPTDILIKDQIRNLRKFHRFDNVTHLILRGENDYSFFKMATNLIFLTPATFQNRNLFGIFRRWRKEIAYVVLDEIHCLSNWGHDFRPEYLMLSKNMMQYLEDARYLGFTATANYTVTQDIQKQLNIPIENFFSPIIFEKYNVRYDFREAASEREMLEQVKTVCEDIVRRDERAIVFTKNEETSIKVAEAIGYEADVFSVNNEDSYTQFAEGLCRILVANEDLGIGINLPNVNCTVHYGMPVSKNEFVQEIGRAGRADERVTAYVIYLEPSAENIAPELLRRDTYVDNLPQMLKAMNNDYSDVYRKLNCGADTSDILYDRLIDIYSNFQAGKKTAYLVHKPEKSIETYKKFIYMLYVTGYVKDWYTYRYVEDEKQVEICVDICSVANSGGHHIVFIDDASMLNRMKTKSKAYFAAMGNDRESIFNINRATRIEDIFKIYVKWYYQKFLYHHKEEFIDFYEFITSNKECDSVKITEEIEDYFVLPFIQIKEDEEYYTGLSVEEISKQVLSGIGKNTLANIERINSSNYSYKLDYLLFIGNWSRSGQFNATRLERFWNKLSNDEKEVFLRTTSELYKKLDTNARWSFIKYLDDPNSVVDLPLGKALDYFYDNAGKDEIYYGILTICANKKFQYFVRS